KVYEELCKVIEEWIDIYEQDGEKLPPATAKKGYSGKFNLRLEKDLHEQIALTAIRKGQSLNKLCVDAIKKEIGL
ncbi:MAG: toxin-antitoxin system HicB family antitoxin, partial [Deltaproteobacteria bacterium]|nr:toxin-antitoxin system HicB family antitoxin [Deltaproteobacteria bacterium]